MNHLYSQGDWISQHVASRAFHSPFDKSHETHLSIHKILRIQPDRCIPIQSTTTPKFIFFRLTFIFSFGIRLYYDVLWNRRNVIESERQAKIRLASQLAMICLCKQSKWFVCYCIPGQFARTSIFSHDKKPNNGNSPVEQFKSNPWYLIFVLFLTNNSEKMLFSLMLSLADLIHIFFSL